MATRPNNGADRDTPPAPEKQQSSLPSYVSAALRVSTSLPLGSDTTDTDVINGKSSKSPIPGIMALDYVPMLGISRDQNSALNRAAFYEFNAIRSKISGNRPYEPADHMIYRMAIDSLRDMYTYACRIYATISTYCATNLYKPRHILSAMDLDADDWIDNAADLYQWLKIHAGSLQPFPTVPLGTITDRRKIFNSVFFTDGELGRSQTYIINQKYFWSYEKVDEVKGLTPVLFPRTYAEFKETWNRMYAALQNSSDVYIIAADIRRAFEDKVVTDMVAPDVDAKVEYVKFDTVLTTIMNASLTPVAGSYSDWDDGSDMNRFRISDQNGILICNPDFEVTLDDFSDWDVPASFKHINCIEADPTPEVLLNAVRGKAALEVDILQGNMSVHILACGTEFFTSARLVTRQIQAGFERSTTTTLGSLGLWFKSAEQDIEVAYAEMAKIANFDWHPPVAYTTVDTDGVTLGNIYIVEDIQNYIPLSNKQLVDIHEAVLLGEFGLPE